VANYPFRGDASDVSGNGNHGEVFGATLTENRDGEPDSAYGFDGQDDHIDVPHSDTLDLEDEISIAAWVYIHAFATNMQVVQKDGLTTPHVYAMPIISSSEPIHTGRKPRSFGLELTLDGQFKNKFFSNTQLETQRWYFLAATYNGGQVDLYLNGNLDSSHITSGTIEVNDRPLGIGYFKNEYRDFMSGIIDELRIYNRALSEPEIQVLYRCWDHDGDGYYKETCGGADCDDTDPEVNPGVDEICSNGIDDDCDGMIDEPDCVAEFILELEATYEEGELSLDFTLGTPEPAIWSASLILTYPTIRRIPLWVVPVPTIDPPFDIPIAFPFTSLGGFWISTGLYADFDLQPEAFDFAWVHIIDQRPVPDTGADTGADICYDTDTVIKCPAPGEPYYGQDAQYSINPISFTDYGDGTVTDNVTDLMWQQTDDDVQRNWEGALAYCEILELAGHTDWRLPDIKELTSIVDHWNYDPAIDTTYFPGTDLTLYWSSSTDITYPGMAWTPFFGSGVVWGGTKIDHDGYVRCVR